MSQDRLLLAGLSAILSEELDKNQIESVEPYVPDVWINFTHVTILNGRPEYIDVKITIENLRHFLGQEGFDLQGFPGNVTDTSTFLERLIKSLEN